jgi:hypothetical protein
MPDSTSFERGNLYRDNLRKPPAPFRGTIFVKMRLQIPSGYFVFDNDSVFWIDGIRLPAELANVRVLVLRRPVDRIHVQSIVDFPLTSSTVRKTLTPESEGCYRQEHQNAVKSYDCPKCSRLRDPELNNREGHSTENLSTNQDQQH